MTKILLKLLHAKKWKKMKCIKYKTKKKIYTHRKKFINKKTRQNEVSSSSVPPPSKSVASERKSSEPDSWPLEAEMGFNSDSNASIPTSSVSSLRSLKKLVKGWLVKYGGEDQLFRK